MIRPREPRRRPPAQYAAGNIDPNATEEQVKWLVEATVRHLLKDIADPRHGEITIVHYDGTPAQIRALWNPAPQ